MGGGTDDSMALGGLRFVVLVLLVLWVLLLMGIFVPAPANALRAAKIGVFDQPVHVTGPPGARHANGQIFVVEQEGRIKVAGRKGRAGTFLDIRSRVGASGERGLLSVAFAPNYRKSGRFYVYYTDRSGDVVIEEYRRAGKRHRKARRGSARTLLRIPHREFSNHNGGQLQFGPDGNLWIGVGDGGGGGDPLGSGQDRDSLLGKLLRIDPRRSAGRPYSIPRGNPFVGRDGRDEIYSIGLRNPYRFSFDRRGGDLLLADVGQSHWEEVNRVRPRAANGANFGWNAFEGAEVFDAEKAAAVAPFHTPPQFTYSHANGNCSITGGYVSRDRRIKGLRGRYVYADFCRGQVRSVRISRRGARGDRPVPGLPTELGISSFGEDRAGRLYVANVDSGLVYRISKPRRAQRRT